MQPHSADQPHTPVTGPAPWCRIAVHPDSYVLQFGGADPAALAERLRSLRGSIPAPRRRWDAFSRSWWIDPVVELMVRSFSRWLTRSFAPDRIHRETHADLIAELWAARPSGEDVEEGWILTPEKKPAAPQTRPHIGPVWSWSRPTTNAAPRSAPTPVNTSQPDPIPPPPAPPRPPANPHAVLWLRDGAPWPVVKAAYRSLASLHHPDKGGDAAQMQEINAAYAILRTQLERAASPVASPVLTPAPSPRREYADELDAD